MTTAEWSIAVFAVTAIGGIARDLIGLRRQQVRRAALRRLVEYAGPGGRVTDNGPDGAIKIEIGQPTVPFDDPQSPAG